VGIREKEEITLLGARFEPVEDEGILWEKEGVCYGREAALQQALRELREREGALYPST
jgi:hypothetical protein